jgi:hypothetical protein
VLADKPTRIIFGVMLRSLLKLYAIACIPTFLFALDIKVEPYATWIYDEPIFQVEFRESMDNFPIQFMLRSNRIEFFDKSGKIIEKYPFNQTQVILKSPKNASIAIMEKQYDYKSVPPAGILSFQIFDGLGKHKYAFAKSFFLFREEPSFQLSDPGILFETDRSKPNVSFYFMNDTLLSESLEDDKVSWPKFSGSEAFLLRSKREILFFSVNARTSPTRNDSFLVLVTDSRLNPLRMEKYKGDIYGHRRIRNSDYFLIESKLNENEETLLFNGSQFIARFPVDRNDMLVSDENELAVRYEKNIEIINVADGESIRSLPLDSTNTILDIALFPEHSIIILLMADVLTNENDLTYYQNIHLQIINNTGEIIDDIKKPAWTTVRPSMTKIDHNTFGFHIHNGVFIYEIISQ